MGSKVINLKLMPQSDFKIHKIPKKKNTDSIVFNIQKNNENKEVKPNK